MTFVMKHTFIMSSCLWSHKGHHCTSRDSEESKLFSEHVDFFCSKMAQLTHCHFSFPFYTLKAASEKKSLVLNSRNASVVSRGGKNFLRLVLNSSVNMSLSCVWDHCLLSEISNCEFQQCGTVLSIYVDINAIPSRCLGFEWLGHNCQKSRISPACVDSCFEAIEWKK